MIVSDVTSFFDNLDHRILHKQWKRILKVESLPDDHYNVYKSLISKRYVNELELFKKISGYLDTLSDKLTQLQPLNVIQESELISEIESCERLVFLGQSLEKLIKKENLNIPYIMTVSLKEMVENPEKKRKLWQDIKELSK